MKLDLLITVDVGQHLSHLFKRLFPKEESINGKLDAILAGQEKIMADLENEFAGFNTELTRLLGEVNTEIQQLADAFAAGNVSAAVVENARGRIVAATAAAKEAADALAVDNPVTA